MVFESGSWDTQHMIYGIIYNRRKGDLSDCFKWTKFVCCLFFLFGTFKSIYLIMKWWLCSLHNIKVFSLENDGCILYCCLYLKRMIIFLLLVIQHCDKYKRKIKWTASNARFIFCAWIASLSRCWLIIQQWHLYKRL